MIVPLADWKDRFAVAPWMVHIEPDRSNGLKKSSAADAFQSRSISHERFIRRLGYLTHDLLAEVLAAIRLVIGS